MEKVPYLNSNNFILVVSLGFREEDLQEDYRAIRCVYKCFISVVAFVNLSCNLIPNVFLFSEKRFA